MIYSFKAYHSSFANNKFRIGNIALLPIRTRYSGPAPTETCKVNYWKFCNENDFFLANENEDIIDEAIKYFRANIFFRNYDIKVNEMNIFLLILYLILAWCWSNIDLFNIIYNWMFTTSSKSKDLLFYIW